MTSKEARITVVNSNLGQGLLQSFKLKRIPLIVLDTRSMDMPVVFVHGITVREERFISLLRRVHGGISDVRPGLKVEGFYWGNKASPQRYRGVSIPEFVDGRRAITITKAGAGGVLELGQLLNLLLDDPYIELTALQDKDKFDLWGRGISSLPRQVKDRNQTLHAQRPKIIAAFRDDPELKTVLGKQIPEDVIIKVVGESLEKAGGADRRLSIADLLEPLVRCQTAAIYMALAGEEDIFDSQFDWTHTERQVRRILESKLGGQRGRLVDKLKDFAFSSVTIAMRKGIRQRMMNAMSLFVGDVLSYLANQKSIIEDLENRIAALVSKDKSPLYLIGHSLGGIICADYCYETQRRIERLFTVGSQVGLLGELGITKGPPPALDGKIEAPDSVNNWVNIYDPNDMLSFLAAPVFTNVADIEYRTNTPFPISHSEYWNQLELYQEMAKYLPKTRRRARSEG